ncbi:MAG: FAD:protein FMN transferase [Deltaproteobacteria bacterium]|nr:FAD:protein FMN transferase [Deltaproteobacteria bacterium]
MFLSNIKYKAIFLSSLCILILATAFYYSSLISSVLPLQEFSGSTMGTFYTVKVVETGGSKDRIKREVLELGIQTALDKVDSEVSTYKESSELSKFNASSDLEWFPVSKDFYNLLKFSLSVSESSGGAFDVTVAPLVNLWGFGPGKSRDRPPTDFEIKEVMASVGYKKISTKSEGGASEDERKFFIKKDSREVSVDLSAVAKGFGLDKVSLFLISLGLSDYLIEVGGEVLVSGKNHFNQPWVIGIATPNEDGELAKVLKVERGCLATSGDYRNYFEQDGVRYSHTIDPKTGRPITHSLASVSVIAKDCMQADGFATAIMVLGKDDGLDFAKKNKLSVFMLVKEGDGFKEVVTPSFEAYFSE